MPRVVESDGSESFGELLRDHRRAAGLTQEELAERAGVSPRSISELERGGAHIPRRDTVTMLARALGLRGKDLEAFELLIERRRKPVVHETPHQLHNLPRALTSFVGRTHELEELGP